MASYRPRPYEKSPNQQSANAKAVPPSLPWRTVRAAWPLNPWSYAWPKIHNVFF